MTLEGKGAAVDLAGEVVPRDLVGRLFVVDHDLVVELDRDVLVLDGDRLGPPLAVRNVLLLDVGDGVEASGLPRVGVVGVVDLGLEAVLRPALVLELRVEVDPPLLLFSALQSTLSSKFLNGLSSPT